MGSRQRVNLRGLIAGVMITGVCLVMQQPCLAESASLVWSRPMGLGLGPTADTVAPTTLRSRSPRSASCSKSRRLAARLGETYAGARFRQAIVERACAFADLAPLEDSAWSWPWAQAEIDSELPPRLHSSHAAWTIRCGSAGNRERCALIHDATANVAPVNGASESVRIITHFVIDQIGGQEHVLWRVFVEKSEPTWFHTGPRVTKSLSGAEVVAVSIGAVAFEKQFDDCGRLGCLMEADVARSARVATTLWEGGVVQIEVRPMPGVVLKQSIPTQQFRNGLRELSRLKHAEERRLAGR